jgi:hypothetical protein
MVSSLIFIQEQYKDGLKKLKPFRGFICKWLDFYLYLKLLWLTIHKGENMSSWQKQVGTIATAVAVLASIWMALSVGIGEASQVVIDPNDPENPLSADTLAVFGGQVDFVDRIAVLGVFTTILGAAGLGILRPNGDLPPFANTLIRYMPVIVGLVAFSAFSTEVFEIVQGDRVWGDYSDGTNSYMLFLTASFIAGLASLLKRN